MRKNNMENKNKRGRKQNASTLYDKVNKVDPEFASSVHTMTDDELKNKLMHLNKYESEMEDAKQNDQELREAKERVKVAMESYREPLKASKLKRKFILQILSERGKV